jgi:hypothetical protein
LTIGGETWFLLRTVLTAEQRGNGAGWEPSTAASVPLLCGLAFASTAVAIGGLLSFHYYPALISGAITTLLLSAIAAVILDEGAIKRTPRPNIRRCSVQTNELVNQLKRVSKNIRAGIPADLVAHTSPLCVSLSILS